MLIRQKAGWCLHHQAYLWPRRSRSSSLSPPVPLSLSSTQRRRRSGTGSGSSAVHSGDDSTLSPVSLRRSSSSSIGLEENDTSPLIWSSSRSRKDSNESQGSSSPSWSTSSRSGPSSSRKRKVSCSAELVYDETQSTGPSLRLTRSSNNISDPAFDERDAEGRHSLNIDSVSRDEHRVWNTSYANAAVPDTPSSRGANFDDEVHASCDAVTNQRVCCHKRREPDCSRKRASRDAKSGECRIADPSISVCTLTCYSSLQGNSSDGINFSSSSNNNNNTISLCGSMHASSSDKECIRESNHRNSFCRTCPGVNNMAVLCAEKRSSEVVPTQSSFSAVNLHLCQSPYGNSNTDIQDNLSHSMPKKISLDTTKHISHDDVSSAVRRRSQRPPSARCVSPAVGHVITQEKISVNTPAVEALNGITLESTVKSLNLRRSHENSRRLLCCFGLDSKAACNRCRLCHTSVAASASLLSTSSPSSLSQSVTPSSMSVTRPCSKANTHIHVNSNPLARAGLSGSLPTPELSGCSIALPVNTSIIISKRPQPLPQMLPLSVLSLSSLRETASQQQQFHQLTQGSKSSSVGSSISSSSSNSSSDAKYDDEDDDVSITAVTTASSSSISGSVISTVHLRQRLHSRSRLHQSFSQPASPRSLTPSSSTPFLITSSSSPSLSTLVNEPSSPIQPSAIPCKWRGCSYQLDPSDLLEHIRKHVEAQIEMKTYACYWADCKVFNKPSWSCSWLERHIVTHSGHRPFKCILDSCGQRFHSQAVLERHVNGHFTVSSQNGVKSGRTRDEPHYLMLHKRRKRLPKHRTAQAVKLNDFFDEQTMAVVKHELQSLTGYTKLDLTGIALHVTFRGLIVARRCTQSGPKQSLMAFMPHDMLEDKWVPEEQAQQMFEMSMPMSGLPTSAVSNLHDSLYRRHRFRKHRRK